MSPRAPWGVPVESSYEPEKLRSVERSYERALGRAGDAGRQGGHGGFGAHGGQPPEVHANPTS